MTVFQGLRVKHQKVGLSRRLKAHTAGGGGSGSHPTPNHGQPNTHEGSSRRPDALLEIYNIFQTVAVYQIFIYIIIFDWER